ncbi:hypothetical protein PoB_003835700 [Plakobranchus ocellatus]|uniref:Uncharacterized protein n=1 Tax=Plakobranchus ocellatus TaxID=259542 RepID=A0AAV4AY57_9GAST|nr:hypothetical protein PoB_003835700 [Plakobranchus ocellatus]
MKAAELVWFAMPMLLSSRTKEIKVMTETTEKRSHEVSSAGDQEIDCPNMKDGHLLCDNGKARSLGSLTVTLAFLRDGGGGFDKIITMIVDLRVLRWRRRWNDKHAAVSPWSWRSHENSSGEEKRRKKGRNDW